MDLIHDLTFFESGHLWQIVIGLGILITALLPRFIADRPFSMPMALLLFGVGVVALPWGLEIPDPIEEGVLTEHLTELGVIISLMGAGIKIDRPFKLRTWNSTIRLLGITMVLSIGLAALAGWLIAAFVPATAMLLGAVIAPTDPVLASEVQVSSPGEGHAGYPEEDRKEITPEKEDEVRFALTSEAGLNDGLAFPFTNMAVLMAMAGAYPGNWVVDWLLIDVLYKLGVGTVMGLAVGFLLARVLMSVPAETALAKAMIGIGALSATLILYGATEAVGGYGFLATFVGAVSIRSYERDHAFHESFHVLTEKAERIMTAGIVLFFGGAIAGGLLAPLTFPLVVTAILIVFLIRPLAGMAGMAGVDTIPWRERMAISFFGIRGIGSFYYLAYALNKYSFAHAEELWALVGLVVVISIVVHGMTASPVTAWLDEMRAREANT